MKHVIIVIGAIGGGAFMYLLGSEPAQAITAAIQFTVAGFCGMWLGRQ